MRKKTEETCFIVGAGSFDGFDIMPEAGDLIIAADGGYSYLQELGIEPDMLMGDFDSLADIPEDRYLIRHSPIKDDTDMALAVAYAVKAGYRRFFLYGTLGGRRLDHTIANLQLLTGMSRQGLEAYLIGQGSIITAVTDGAVSFPETASGMISVFCMGDAAAGVSESGLKYCLSDATMTCDNALGVSNEFIGSKSRIEVKKGTLLIMWGLRGCGLPAERSTAAKGVETSSELLIPEI